VNTKGEGHIKRHKRRVEIGERMYVVIIHLGKQVVPSYGILETQFLHSSSFHDLARCASVALLPARIVQPSLVVYPWDAPRLVSLFQSRLWPRFSSSGWNSFRHQIKVLIQPRALAHVRPVFFLLFTTVRIHLFKVLSYPSQL
jgi:hypothetical protein